MTETDLDFGLVSEVAESLAALPTVEGRATVGFDGFTDAIVRVAKGVSEDGVVAHFQNKREFGARLVDLGSHNASFDLTRVATKIGGNGPNTAQALGRLGLDVDCIGMLGHPDIHDLFKSMDANCRLHSYADPVQTTALEFDDGKVLLAESTSLQNVNWPTVRDAIGLDRLIGFYENSDIVCFANWGEIEHATAIWEGIETEVLAVAGAPGRRIVLFDLADPTKRGRDFDRMTGLIGRLSKANETVLCLNRNEAQAVARHLGIPAASADEVGAQIFESIAVNTLIIRDPHSAGAWTENGAVKARTFYERLPLLSTGGGDNFNAGYCYARLVGLDTLSALVVGAAVAGLYVTSGRSPTRGDAIDFLRLQTSGRTRLPEAAQ